MKPLTLSILSLAVLAMPAFAADRMPAMDHGAMHAHGRADTALADGVVKKVDKAGGKLTVAHGPLPNGMPAMTMPFRVKDAAWLERVKEGQNIRFATEEVNGVSTITRLEMAK